MVNIKKSTAKKTSGETDVYNEQSTLILVNQIARIEFERIAKVGGLEYDFNESARLILLKISENEGCTQQDIVRITNMKKPTVSVIMSRFDDLGLIDKHVDEIDHRASRLTLTEKGKETVSVLRKFFESEEKIAMEGLSVNETATLIKLLSKVRYNLSDNGRIIKE